MNLSSLEALGGLGLFLIGMMMLTDGLRALSGRRVRDILRRSTRSPLEGAVAGALTTAMVQSSSATTVATVGFAAAGLMTFQQTLGIIFGANIGTTLTGWLVAIVGFKLELGTLLMPVALAGALLKLFSRSHWSHIGWSLAGFSVLFIGISALQDGMLAYKNLISPDRFPTDTVLGRLELVGLGIAVTVVTQSSSAGVAAALTALSVDAITFPQAAAMVIGMNVGTTFTAALATVGGSVAARRTGFAHVIYNVLTGVMAFLLLYPLDWIVRAQGAAGADFDAQIWLVAFHTAFNMLGVLAVIGVTGGFARLVIRLVPEHGQDLTRRLDWRLQKVPGAAVDAARATVEEIARELFLALDRQLGTRGAAFPRNVSDRIRNATRETREFARAVSTVDDGNGRTVQVDLLHGLDHIDRLRHRCSQEERILTIQRTQPLRRFADDMRAVLRAGPEDASSEPIVHDLLERLRAERETYRNGVISQVAASRITADELTDQLDANRWLLRSCYHVWRILHHLGRRPEETASTQEAERERMLAAAED